MIKKVLFLFVIIAMIATTTNAQKLMLGPQLGYFAASEEGQDGSLLFGAAARLKFGSLGVEGAINYRSESADEGGVETDASFFPVLISGMLYPLPIIYGTAGIGYYNWKIETSYMGQSFEADGSDIGYHVGAGAEIPLGNLVLSADLKYVFMKYDLDFSGITSEVEANGFIINATLFFKL